MCAARAGLEAHPPSRTWPQSGAGLLASVPDTAWSALRLVRVAVRVASVGDGLGVGLQREGGGEGVQAYRLTRAHW